MSCLSKERLEDLYWKQGLSTRAIGQFVGIDGSNVYRRIVQLNIPLRTKKETNAKFKKIKLSKKELEALYCDEKLSAVYIADKMGCTTSTVMKWLRRYEVKIRTLSEAQKLSYETGRRQVKEMPEPTGRTFFKKGHVPWNKKPKNRKGCEVCGETMYLCDWELKRRTCSKECERKWRSENQRGKNNPCWREGSTPIGTLIRSSPEYEKWRNSVFERDAFTCQKCGVVSGVLHAHHIKPFADFPELRFDVNNGLTLHKDCHHSEHGMFGYDKVLEILVHGLAHKEFV